MTNTEIIKEIEKNTGLKVIEDVYPDCDCFICVKLENDEILTLDKMTNGGKANVRRRVFTDEEQIKEIKKRCELILKKNGKTN